jgi:hypothetical protein
VAFGLFSAPNTTAIMNSIPARHRGAASGMRATFYNAGTPLSIGVFFSLMVVGLATRVPPALVRELTRSGVALPVAARLSHLPPIGYLFAAFLGYNPLKTLLGPGLLGSLPPADAAHLTGQEFFPSLIAGPFKSGLVAVLSFSMAMCLVAATASWLRGGRYVDDGREAAAPAGAGRAAGAEEQPAGVEVRRR